MSAFGALCLAFSETVALRKLLYRRSVSYVAFGTVYLSIAVPVEFLQFPIWHMNSITHISVMQSVSVELLTNSQKNCFRVFC